MSLPESVGSVEPAPLSVSVLAKIDAEFELVALGEAELDAVKEPEASLEAPESQLSVKVPQALLQVEPLPESGTNCPHCSLKFFISAAHSLGVGPSPSCSKKLADVSQSSFIPQT